MLRMDGRMASPELVDAGFDELKLNGDGTTGGLGSLLDSPVSQRLNTTGATEADRAETNLTAIQTAKTSIIKIT